MRPALLIPLLVLCGACAGPLPLPDPQQAWISLASRPGQLLMADRLDNRPVKDGRYFQVRPGAHELQVRLQFEVPGGGGIDGLAEPQTRTCLLRLHYAGFAAGQRYVLRAGEQGYRPWARLYDDQQHPLARARVQRCGAF